MFEYMHSKNIIYRDLKPENLLLDESGSGRVMLADFGLSRELDFYTHNKYSVGIGSGQYADPQVDEGNYNRADQWSLVVISFECLCNRLLSSISVRVVSAPIDT